MEHSGAAGIPVSGLRGRREPDAAGNGPSGPSAALQVTIDTAVPSAPSAPDLAAGSDALARQARTTASDTTPTFNGTATVGATWPALAGSTSIRTATNQGSGAWAITTGALTAGTYAFTAKATDVADERRLDRAVGDDPHRAHGDGRPGRGRPTPPPPRHRYAVVFSGPLQASELQSGDVTFSGAGATPATVSGSGTTYTVAISGMTSAGAAPPRSAPARPPTSPGTPTPRPPPWTTRSRTTRSPGHR